MNKWYLAAVLQVSASSVLLMQDSLIAQILSKVLWSGTKSSVDLSTKERSRANSNSVSYPGGMMDAAIPVCLSYCKVTVNNLLQL